MDFFKINKHKKIVCLGGGIGTVQVIRALRPYVENITVVVSMADDGGSAGRLRRLYSVPPPGDLINCIAALSDAEPVLKDLLTYRLEGNRWGREDSIGGHKIGNLMLVALTKILGDFNKALLEAERIFACKGRILPSTYESVSIWAKTTNGEKVLGEETIDLGKYKDTLYSVHLEPKNVKTPQEVVNSINDANVIIIGPGDLYTTILPVLLVPDIQKAVKSSKAKKIFVGNIANKRETKGYSLHDYLEAIKRHCDGIAFNITLVNSNQKMPMKPKNQYSYVPVDYKNGGNHGKIVTEDLVDEEFPVQHDPNKLGSVLRKVLGIK